MIDVEPLIVSSFERIYPPPTGEADWNEVLRRAGVRSRRYLIAVAVVAALLLAPAAWAVSRAFEGKPAPPSIRHDLQSSNDAGAKLKALAGAAPKQVRDSLYAAAKAFARGTPIVSKAHGVMQLQTGGGLIDLWAAPTRDGGVCDWIAWQSDLQYPYAVGSNNCYPATSPVLHDVQVSWGGGDYAHKNYEIVDGYAYGGATTVRLTFADGRAMTVPVVEHLFLGALRRGPRSLASGHKINVRSVTARNKRGKIVGYWRQSFGLGSG